MVRVVYDDTIFYFNPLHVSSIVIDSDDNCVDINMNNKSYAFSFDRFDQLNVFLDKIAPIFNSSKGR